MSDYIFTSKNQSYGILAGAIESIYINPSLTTYEIHGSWGTLAVSNNHYHGFQPYENDQHLMVVIGGPALYFRDNDFLTEEDSNAATVSIYNRWIVDKKIQWDEDLSGPFTILLISKQDKMITAVTDLMAFIPVYSCRKAGEVYLGTHIDALANVAGEQSMFDQVSLADFVLNDAITYPFTAYENIRQLQPSSEVSYSPAQETPKISSYWVPKENNPYKTVSEAARALRQGISGYVDRVTGKMTKVAQFISAGEDSRSLSGILPDRLERDAFIFLDSMNREGRIAKQVAKAYGANFNVGYRSFAHYLEILPEASKLVGSGHQYFHAHSLIFDKKFELASYPAVFGGYLADSLLKAAYTRKLKGIDRLPFIPEFPLTGENRTKPIKSRFIKESILDEVNRRRTEQFMLVKAERPITAHEWFVLRPATMRVAIPNLYTTRRLFRSYEPFMCKESVKISASIPTHWKLNRRIFNLAMKPYLRKSKWIFHADGRLPYFSWWVNLPLKSCVWVFRQLAKRAGFIRGNQGPWGDWNAVMSSHEWKITVENFAYPNDSIKFLDKQLDLKKALTSNEISLNSRINLMQIAFMYKSTQPIDTSFS